MMACGIAFGTGLACRSRQIADGVRIGSGNANSAEDRIKWSAALALVVYDYAFRSVACTTRADRVAFYSTQHEAMYAKSIGWPRCKPLLDRADVDLESASWPTRKGSKESVACYFVGLPSFDSNNSESGCELLVRGPDGNQRWQVYLSRESGQWRVVKMLRVPSAVAWEPDGSALTIDTRTVKSED